jgi:hypothetical protein
MKYKDVVLSEIQQVKRTNPVQEPTCPILETESRTEGARLSQEWRAIV